MDDPPPVQRLLLKHWYCTSRCAETLGTAAAMPLLKLLLLLLLLFADSTIFLPFTQAVDPFQGVVPAFSNNAVIVNAWEPQIAVTSDYIYVFATNVGGVPPCLLCGDDPIIYRKTEDYGATWMGIGSNLNNPWGYVYNGSLTWFADSVVYSDEEGNLYLTYIGYSEGEPWNILFQTSSDDGNSWTAPVVASGNISADKNWMAIDEVNEIYYVTFNQQYPFCTVSMDGGATFSDPIQLDDIATNYYYANGGAVLSNGSVAFAYVATPNDVDNEVGADDESSVYDDDSNDKNVTTGNYTYGKVFVSNDYGKSYIVYNISRWIDSQKCPTWGQCAVDYFTGSSNLAVDALDNIYYMYNGDDNSTSTNEQRAMLAVKSTSDSQFGAPIDVSDAPLDKNVYHFSVLVACGPVGGDVRVAWMDNRTGMWNVYYRESTNFGRTFSSSVRVSTNSNQFEGFQSDEGFLFPYGDYGSLKVDGDGHSHIIWGEGLYWYGGGTVMYSTQASLGDGDDDDGAAAHSGLSTDAKIVMSVVLTALASAVLTIAFMRYLGYSRDAASGKLGFQSGDVSNPLAENDIYSSDSNIQFK